MIEILPTTIEGIKNDGTPPGRAQSISDPSSESKYIGYGYGTEDALRKHPLSDVLIIYQCILQADGAAASVLAT